MEFAELVMRRRTVRRFEDAPVDRAILEGSRAWGSGRRPPGSRRGSAS